MHLPHIDPNFVLWCTLVADVITSIASSVAAVGVIRIIWKKVAPDVKKAVDTIVDDSKKDL